MKQSFMTAMLPVAIAEGTGGETVVAPKAPAPEKVYTSDKLTELREGLKTKWQHMVSQEPGSKEALDANLEVYKQQKLIEAEIAALKKAEAELIAIENRNKKIAIFDETIAAYDALQVINADKKATVEAKNEAATRYKDLSDKVKNALAGSLPTAPKPTGDGETKEAGARGATSTKIREELSTRINGGMSATYAVKEVIALGYTRGTVGTVRTQMKNEGLTNEG